MITPDSANQFRGRIIELSTSFEHHLDQFFIKLIVGNKDKLRSAFFMDLFIDSLTFGNKVNRYNQVLNAYFEKTDKKCEQIKSRLGEFVQIRNTVAHRSGYVNELGNLLLFTFGKDDIQITENELEKIVQRWNDFHNEFADFTSDFVKRFIDDQ